MLVANASDSTAYAIDKITIRPLFLHVTSLLCIQVSTIRMMPVCDSENILTKIDDRVSKNHRVLRASPHLSVAKAGKNHLNE